MNEINPVPTTAPGPIAVILGVAIKGIATLRAETFRNELKRVITDHTTSQSTSSGPRARSSVLAGKVVTALLTAVLVHAHVQAN